MDGKTQLKTGSDEWLRNQIAAYREEQQRYAKYADTLRRILGGACKDLAPLAIVQARAKELSSFAEKALRKAFKYDNPVRQVTDLCGARVITHTQAQAEEICRFIRENFIVDEANSLDTAERLTEKEFGYKSFHFVVQLRRKPVLGVAIPAAVGQRKAEIQVRTLLQHAWADIVHDRVYKTALKIQPVLLRDAHRIAAVLEDADADFARMVEDFDALTGEHGAYMTREDMEKELQTLQAILKAEPDPSRKPLTALRLARIAKAAGDWRTAIRALSPHARVAGAIGDEVRLELGNSLCRASRGDPRAAAYGRGQRILARVARPEEIDIRATSPLVIRVDERRARALYQLAWSHRDLPRKETVARGLYYKAYLCDPYDPCHLSAFLEYEVCCGRGMEALQLMRPQMIEAIERCGRHAESRLELPWLFYSAGMLNLLLGRPYESLAAYARAAELSNNEFPIQQALGSIERLRCSVGTAVQGIEWVRRFLILADAAKLMHLHDEAIQRIQRSKDRLSAATQNFEAAIAAVPSFPKGVDDARKEQDAAAAAFKKAGLEAEKAAGKAAEAVEGVRRLATKRIRAMQAPVLYVAGGCDPSVSEEMRRYSRCVAAALEGFAGTVFSGGTTAGVPGLVGEISAALKREGRKGYTLVGYLPVPGPKGAVADWRRYDQLHRTRGKDFTAVEPLQNWTDIIACGVRPGDVRVLGINGGRIAAFEYRLALALGATVGVLESSGRAATAVLPDAFWWPAGRLVRLPKDSMTAKVFADPPRPFPLSDPREAAAEAVHNKFLSQNRHKAKDPTLVEWPYLRPDIRDSNRMQVAYAERVLRSAGYGIRETREQPKPIEFAVGEVEAMAEMEHGRWNAERLSSGWSYAPQRDPEQKKSPYLVPWKELPEAAKEWDRESIRNFPRVFEKAHMEICRLSAKEETNKPKPRRARGARKPKAAGKKRR